MDWISAITQHLNHAKFTVKSSMEAAIESIGEWGGKVHVNISNIESDMVIKWSPLFFLVFLFWPVILTLIVSFATASGWLFWLLTSLIFGFVQFFYVIYQFWMISLDIAALTMLKAFATLRSYLIYYGYWTGLMKSSKYRKKGSQKRYWKTRLYATNQLKDYNEIPIEEADDKPLHSSSSLMNPSKSVTKSKSCTNLPSKALFPSTHPTHNHVHNLAKPERSKNNHALSHSHSSASFKKEEYLSDDPDGEAEYLHLVEKQIGVTGGMLITTTNRLQEARLHSQKHGDSSSLKFLLSGVIKRNHLNVDNFLLEDARSVDSIGQYSLPKESKEVIHGYMDEVEACLRFVSDSPLSSPANSSSISSSSPTTPTPKYNNTHKHSNSSFLHKSLEDANRDEANECRDRMQFLHKLKQNMGSTALMLSGGGAQAMYHTGTIRALLEANLYSKFTVISGTSGGSITAAMCAIKTPKELLDYVCVPNVSTDFMKSGKMKKENIRWFPSLMEMGTFWMKNKLLVDSKDFKKCCDFYYGDITFEEAFQRTGKHVCITVSASRASNGGGGAQRLLLNHISTPHVTLSSAVGASCALPGVMAPAKLMAKDSEGNLEPFEVDGVEWIDGSVQADLPFRRISTLFNVSEYIVCQCNFHVVPFLNKPHHPNKRSMYWRIFQNCEWDIRNRALNLSRLGLFPKIFGQDISKVFKQKYHGNLTLVPRFTKMQLFGLKALTNPTVEDMKIYIKYGQIAAFPYLSVMRHMLRLESEIDACLSRTELRREAIMSDDMSLDGSAISSMSLGMFRTPRFYSAAKDAEKLERKNNLLEKENMELKRRINLLEEAMGAKMTEEEKKYKGEIFDEKKDIFEDELLQMMGLQMKKKYKEKETFDDELLNIATLNK